MANLNVDGTISGVVNGQYKYIKFWETYDFNGQPRHRIWTAWFDGVILDGFNEGDFIQINGDLGTKVGTYNKPGDETRQVVEHSLNNCRIVTHAPKTATPAPVSVTSEIEMPF